MEAPKGIQILAEAGDIQAICRNELRLESKDGEVGQASELSTILLLSLVLYWVYWVDRAKLVVLEATQGRSDSTLFCILHKMSYIIIFVKDLQSSHWWSAPEISFCPLAILAKTGIPPVIDTSPVQVVGNLSQQSNHWLAVVGHPPELSLTETLNHAFNSFSGILINFPALSYLSPPFSALFLSLTLLISLFPSHSSRLRLNAASSHIPLLNSSIHLAIGYAHQATYSSQSAALIKGFPTTGCSSRVMSDLLKSAED